ncbi:MAG: hypothetical protein H6953_08475 [Chromatiaceae bacterium]|nr:hypothetical protein [Gammaproteobacteria bacterium]MCP5305469.1 hypothetical protein [Chromatiaceae bacterium]MCP5315428.1 hypothetical protein [Chromatiaceae bacterium]
MSLENEGLPVSWDEIKEASRRLDWAANEGTQQRRVARDYLAHTECEDSRVQEHVAIPGYN